MPMRQPDRRYVDTGYRLCQPADARWTNAGTSQPRSIDRSAVQRGCTNERTFVQCRHSWTAKTIFGFRKTAGCASNNARCPNRGIL